MKVLREELRLRGYALRDVIGDGNCFFRSVAYHVSGDEDDYPSIRASAVKELRVSDWVRGWVGLAS